MWLRPRSHMLRRRTSPGRPCMLHTVLAGGSLLALPPCRLSELSARSQASRISRTESTPASGNATREGAGSCGVEQTARE